MCVCVFIIQTYQGELNVPLDELSNTLEAVGVYNEKIMLQSQKLFISLKDRYTFMSFKRNQDHQKLGFFISF